MRVAHTDEVSLLGDLYDRVSAARPFLRWVGGKQTFVARYGRLLPVVGGHYFEPFLGSGAVFFYLQARHGRPLEATLGDTNRALMRTYVALRSDPDKLSRELEDLFGQYSTAPSQEAFYYTVRDRFNKQLPSPDPALFIFLNRTCWNGLYRVNRNGKFNVPYGRATRDEGTASPDLNLLRSAAAGLIRAKLKSSSWEATIIGAARGDFVFLDPPYFSDISREATKYRVRQFGLGAHQLLADRLRLLVDREVDFVLTNSADEEMIELYSSRGLGVAVIEMPRSVSSKLDRRGPARELVVTSPDSEFLARLRHTFSQT